MSDSVSKAHRREALEQSKKFATSPGQHDSFGGFASKASSWLGSKWSFLGAVAVIVVWAISGPFFHYSNTWQLVINTGTTIVTFLMVFLIQNTQNRDSRAINLKLNELIYSIDAAADQMLDIETLSDEELTIMQKRYERIRAACLQRTAKDKHANSTRNSQTSESVPSRED